MRLPAFAPKYRLLVTLAVLLLSLASLAPCAGDRLADGFRNPPNSARPWVWWHWMNGAISKEGIKADLEAMHEAGIGGAQIFNVDCGTPHGPIQFMSPEWRDAFKYAIEQASRLGLEMGMHNAAGWSSSGGPWITPELGQQELVWTETAAAGPSSFSQALPQPRAQRGFYRDIAVYAFRTPAAPIDENRMKRLNGLTGRARWGGIEPDMSATPAGLAIARADVLDITGKMASDGNLAWQVPDGNWTILRIGHTVIETLNSPAPPEGTGLECDKMSKAGIDAHWAAAMAPVLSDIGRLAGKTLTNCLVDSFERGGQNWTDRMRAEFAARCGYDPMPFVPALTGRIIESTEVTERFLWDWRRTIADMQSDNYFGRFAELCHKAGMSAAIEPYGDGTFDDLQIGAHADLPMGEFWVGGGFMNGSAKLAASAAHTAGHPVAGTESFTADWNAGRWQVDPASIKAQGDGIYCLGINRFIFHRYAHQPWMNVRPGMTMGPWGMNLERTITWWDQSKSWLGYLSRCQYMLQSGTFAADICYYLGETAPVNLPPSDQLRPALPKGYDYDACSADTLMLMSVRNGRITLPGGMSYQVLSLPESRFMTPRVAHKVRDLVKAGATVIGPKPQVSPSLSGYPQCDDELKALANEVWGDCDGADVKEHKLGKGRVVCGKPLGDVLRECGLLPDFVAASGGDAVDAPHIHRRVSGTDVYFVSNQDGSWVSLDCTFRVSGKVPELWHAESGAIERAPVYEDKNGLTTMPLTLEPAGSVFVVFRERPADKTHLVSVKSPPGPKIDIAKAIYEATDGDNGSSDVTHTVARLVSSGKKQFAASNDLFSDPAYGHAKQLRIEYTVDGALVKKTVPENALANVSGSLNPDYELAVDDRGWINLKTWKAGDYALTTASGDFAPLRVKRGAERTELASAWDVTFPPNLGAPAGIKLDRLISWAEHSDPGVRYFSGTATYTTTFDAPTRSAKSACCLDLGNVKSIAEVTLNGKDLGCLWKAPFRVDVTNVLKPKGNSLVVRVTNLWVNRLIGDAQFPDDCEWNSDGSIAKIPEWVTNGGPRPEPRRVAFTTWRFYDKDSPLLESGLIGPVSLWDVPVVTARVGRQTLGP